MTSELHRKRQAAIDAFDKASNTYDAEFCLSALGHYYRERVQCRLDTLFQPGMLVLDIGCGTGEDALHLAKRGISILACDISPGMLNRAEDKIKKAGYSKDIELRQVPVEGLTSLIEELPLGFDGVYSNFGPLNMIPDLSCFARLNARLLNPGGKSLHVVMARKPFFETIYYLLHFKTARAFSRWDGSAGVPVGSHNLSCRFYQPWELDKIFKYYFTVTRIEALGILLPPPYLSGHYRRRRTFYKSITGLDKFISTLPFFNSIGDHFIIELIREPDLVQSVL